MSLGTRPFRAVRALFGLAAAAALGLAWAGTASAAPPAGAPSAADGAVTKFSWSQPAYAALVLPPPHEPDRGTCTATRIGRQIRMDCVIRKADTTLWVACSGGFVEIRHLPVGTISAQGTCPTYGGYALTYTSAD